MVKVVDDGIFPAPRDKVWRLLQAHAPDGDVYNIHPKIKSVKHLGKEGDADVVEQRWEIGGQLARYVLKVSVSPPDCLAIEFLEGPMTGRIVSTYIDVPEGTRVTVEADMKSNVMNDQQLEATVRQWLNDTFNDDLRYLNKMK